MGRPPGLRRLAGGVRFRILASFVILLAFALLISVLLARQALLVRLDDSVARDLAQEAREFNRLAGGTDPETGRPFGADVQRIFTVYLGRNVPGRGEQLLAVPRRGQPRYRAAEEADVRIDDFYIDRWRRLTETEQDELQTAAGTARYTAIPLVVDGRPLGSFVVAHFTAGERHEVAETVRIVAAVSAAVLLLGSIGAFIAAGRVLAPLREFRDATRSVSGADMTRRIGVEGSDELADVGNSFNRMIDRLEFAFSSQRDFIRDISHELRTPIAVIRGHLELMAEGGKSVPDERAATLALVTRELDRMSGFVDDLLLLAKTEQPDFLHLETVPLGEFCEDIVASARGLAPRDWRLASAQNPPPLRRRSAAAPPPLRRRSAPPPPLRPASATRPRSAAAPPPLRPASRHSIVADPQRLTQAVMNLVRNAVEHTAEGDMIEIGTSVSGKVASVWVRDSGPGVASGEQRRIFERFERGSASRTSYEGSGLGLAITRAIAEAHGGRVRLQSRLGEGATFFVEVPVDGPGGGEMAA